MAEKRLTITKEQAEAFVEWKQEYEEDVKFARAVLIQELGTKNWHNSKLAKNLERMLVEIANFNVAEGCAEYYGEEITSDMQFGVSIMKLTTVLTNMLWDQQTEKIVDLANKFRKSEKKLYDIFNIKTFS